MASSSMNSDSAGHLPEVRVSTGVRALDTILHGGLVAHRPYLVVGPSGTGKTTLALEFLCQGVREGERVLMVTLEEPPNEMRRNHRALGPELDDVYVFDAIPDVMRYERAPFRDIATVRQSVKFRDVPDAVRKSPELASVEVTLTALEQTIRMEILRFGYSRIVIDSLTALQYFCMKGFDETAGAQSFLRFLSDLKVTTLLTVEAPLEDVESPERLLARGEVRLFRWELDGRTVRAMGVEKFRGSPHDVFLHPYRIGPQGIDVDLAATISRDTRRESVQPLANLTPRPATGPNPQLVLPSSVGPWTQDLLDLATVGADLRIVRELIQRASTAAREDQTAVASELLVQVRGEVASMVEEFSHHPLDIALGQDPDRTQAVRRLVARAAEARVGLPPPTGVDVSALPSTLDVLLPSQAGTAGPPGVSSNFIRPAAVSSTEVSRGPSAIPPTPATERGPNARPSLRPSVSLPAPAPDLSSAAARLPTTRVDETVPAAGQAADVPPEPQANWESPALLPDPSIHPASGATLPIALVSPVVHIVVDPPPLPRPQSDVEYLRVPPPPGSSSSGDLRLPVHVASPAMIAGVDGSVVMEGAGQRVQPGSAGAVDRPPLPTLSGPEATRAVVRPVVMVGTATIPPRPTPSTSAKQARRASRSTSAPAAAGGAPAGREAPKRRRRTTTSRKHRSERTGAVSSPGPAASPTSAITPLAKLGLNAPAPPERAFPPLPEGGTVPRTDGATALGTPNAGGNLNPPVSPEVPVTNLKRRPARRRKAPPVTGVAPGSRSLPDPSPTSTPPAGAVPVVSESSPPPPAVAATPAPGPSTEPSMERRD